MERAQGWFEPLLDLANRGDVHRGGKTIVRGLSEIDVIVLDAPAVLRPARRRVFRAIGNDLIDVHVGLRSGACLPNPQRKFSIETPGFDFAGGGDRGT
jgi:hypothetical protein